MLSEKRIKDLVKEKEAYLNALEEFDRTGVLKKVAPKVRFNFTLDEMLMADFRKVCEAERIPMSRQVEDLIRKFLKEKGVVK